MSYADHARDDIEDERPFRASLPDVPRHSRPQTLPRPSTGSPRLGRKHQRV